MLSTTATVDDSPWLTGDEESSENRVALLFSNLIHKKVLEREEKPMEFQDAFGNEVLQTEISELNRQWRDQQVTGLIRQIRSCVDVHQGSKLAERLYSLRNMLKEEEGKEADISPESLRALHIFLRHLGRFRLPELSLTPEAEVYIRWKDGTQRVFAVHFENDRRVRFVVFSPNPRHSGIVNRLSGIEAVDTVLETADRAFSVKTWIGVED